MSKIKSTILILDKLIFGFIGKVLSLGIWALVLWVLFWIPIVQVWNHPKALSFNPAVMTHEDMMTCVLFVFSSIIGVLFFILFVWRPLMIFATPKRENKQARPDDAKIADETELRMAGVLEKRQKNV